MIYSLQGTLTLIENNFVVVSCGGVGYKCFTSFYTQNQLMSKINESVTVYTHVSVRQDAIDIFGFSSKSELECFKLLTTVSGVGPKAALSILSQFSAEKIAMIISCGDSKSLTSASGIGAKTAQRIVLELKDKLKSISGEKSEIISNAINFSQSKNSSEAVKALEVLGYSSSEVLPIISTFDENCSVEELIQKTLRLMAKGV